MTSALDTHRARLPPLEHPLEEGWTLPASWYSDAGVAALERERIFARTWQYGGPAEQVATPGSFMATQAGHIPIVVTRDREGVLRGFVNVCRHRAYDDRAGLRQPRDAAVPVPRLDVRARRLAAKGAALGARGGLRPRRLLAAPRLGRHVGAVPLRQPRPGRGAARRDARRAAGDRRAERPRPLDARLPLPPRVADRGELEGRARELPRVLPLPDRPSRASAR